jgi:5-methyltetrahydropteroyltriglutamate--homocysteine methyltransferase
MPKIYRADHVGSLLRPPELLAARAAHAGGRLGAAELRAVEDRSIFDVLQLQRQVGVDVFTDGEYRRSSWLGDMAEAVEGFVPERVEIHWRGPGGGIEGSTAHVVAGRLRQVRRLTAHQSSFLRAHAPGPFKMTIPSPSVFMLTSYKPGVTDRYYPTRGALLQDLVPIVQNELRALVEEVVPYVQLDAPQYTFYVDPQVRDRLRQAGVDPDAAFDDALAADGACLQGLRREGVTVAMHVCRGNNRSRWFTEGGYDSIAEKFFGSLPVDRFLLEYDTGRAGGFEPLRFVPRGKTVVLGLITTKEGRLELPEVLLRRIDEASRYVPLDHLAISPQCGFASAIPGNLLSADEQRQKLELVVEIARKVWG